MTPFTTDELADITHSTAAGHGNGGGTSEWNARWLATLDAARSSPAPAEGLDVERLVTAFHSEFCSPNGHPAAYDRPIIAKVAEAYTRLSPPVDRDAPREPA